MKREYFFDFIRGVAIILVVAIHCYPSHIRFNDGPDALMMICIRNIMNCAVPLFLAISGYFLTKRVLISKSFDWKLFWTKQISKVYFPCIIFSIPWLLLDIYSGSSWYIAVIKALLCGMSVYYFILLIICCYLSAPLMMKMKESFLFAMSASLAFTTISIGLFYDSLGGWQLPLIIQGSIISFGVFFAIGIVLGRLEKTYTLTWPVIIIILGFILSIAETIFWQIKYGAVGAGQKASSFIFNIGIIFLLFCPTVKNKYTDNKIQRIFRWIGDISFGIYFTHILVLYSLKKFNLSIMENWMVSTLVTIVVTITIIEICKRIIPDFSRKYLGFR